MTDQFYQSVPYTAPTWAAHLKGIPKCKIKLSALNTPIHKWHIPQLPEGFSLSIKRDDLTGCELSGNKVRNLEFLFADAISKGCRHVVTGGGPQSGHCRAVSLTARALGMEPHVVVEGAEQEDDLGKSGNALLSRLTGSPMYLTPYKGIRHFQQRVRMLAEYISKKIKGECYCIPVGGSSPLGLYGFLSLFEELVAQGVLENFDDVVVTVATGGTATGLSLGNYLTGSKLKIHAISIALGRELLYADSNRLLEQVSFTEVPAESLFDIIEDYIGEGYGKVTNEGLEFISTVCSTTGILLDPIYTGKAANGLVKELHTNPKRFKGNRILFIHTGGMFGLFTGVMDGILTSSEVTGKVIPWPQMDISPL